MERPFFSFERNKLPGFLRHLLRLQIEYAYRNRAKSRSADLKRSWSIQQVVVQRNPTHDFQIFTPIADAPVAVEQLQDMLRDK